jgi:YidC/Oxa1 family membrane protein insertase
MFHTYLYLPLLNSLIFLYENFSFESFGLAIILLTLLIRFILFPLFYKSAKSQLVMQKLQPTIQKIQKDNKDNKEKQAQELLSLYRKNDVNPFISILMVFVQLPILIALYRLFMSDFSALPIAELYSFVSQPEHINTVFLGLIDLKSRSILMVGLAAVAQYFQGKLTLPKTDKKNKDLSTMERMTKQMVFFGPMFTVLILWQLPSALGLYWLITSVFSVIQQLYINKKIKVEVN